MTLRRRQRGKHARYHQKMNRKKKQKSSAINFLEKRTRTKTTSLLSKKVYLTKISYNKNIKRQKTMN